MNAVKTKTACPATKTWGASRIEHCDLPGALVDCAWTTPAVSTSIADRTKTAPTTQHTLRFIVSDSACQTSARQKMQLRKGDPGGHKSCGRDTITAGELVRRPFLSRLSGKPCRTSTEADVTSAICIPLPLFLGWWQVMR
jgi:hypothetical protein